MFVDASDDKSSDLKFVAVHSFWVTEDFLAVKPERNRKDLDNFFISEMQSFLAFL